MATALVNGPWKNDLASNVRPRDPWTQPFRVVLHRTINGDGWVTHLENMAESSTVSSTGYQSKPHPDYYWGHYFQEDYAAALKDYHQRCAKYGL